METLVWLTIHVLEATVYTHSPTLDSLRPSQVELATTVSRSVLNSSLLLKQKRCSKVLA
jgi:hypothetical protein